MPSSSTRISHRFFFFVKTQYVVFILYDYVIDTILHKDICPKRLD
jgi:hypothetical protein